MQRHDPLLITPFLEQFFFRFLCQVLRKSLSLSREELSCKLRHISYDGVYTTSEARGKAGGGLSLVHHVEDYLGLERGDITSNWDIGHKV